jgi:hypothetical protein
MYRLTLTALSYGFGVVFSLAQAAAPNGIWKFDRSADYDGRVPLGLCRDSIRSSFGMAKPDFQLIVSFGSTRRSIFSRTCFSR